VKVMESGNKHIRGTGRERVYNFIVEFMKKNGYAPSVREICVGTDLSSTFIEAGRRRKNSYEKEIY